MSFIDNGRETILNIMNTAKDVIYILRLSDNFREASDMFVTDAIDLINLHSEEELEASALEINQIVEDLGISDELVESQLTNFNLEVSRRYLQELKKAAPDNIIVRALDEFITKVEDKFGESIYTLSEEDRSVIETLTRLVENYYNM